MRDLLKTSNTFVWDEAIHLHAFKRTKTALANTPILAHYKQGCDTALQVDASRLKGLGYCLLQKQDGDWRVIQCGSRFLSPAESRYAMVELELLGAVWAASKTRIYTLGRRDVSLITDHQPLVSIINSRLMDQIPNPRIFCLKEKLLPYPFRA